jgi:ribosomal protein S27E
VYCAGCTSLTTLSLPKAGTVDCQDCASLTTLDLPKATTVDCDGCKWVKINPEYANNIIRLVTLQGIIRRYLKRRRFKVYISSEKYFGWFWGPDAPGGRIQKKHTTLWLENVNGK